MDTIESVLANEFPSFELIVIDQSQNDETERALHRFRSDTRLRYVRADSTGIGPSRYMAVEEAAAEYVAFTDDDCVVPKDWLRTICRLLDDNPRVGMLYCNVVAAPHDRTAGFIPAYDSRGDRIASKAWHKCAARGIGAGMAMRRSAAQAVGNFDRSLGSLFPGVVGEEGDLALRMILRGFHVLETGQTAVVHDGFRSWEQGRDLTRRNFVGIGLVYAKPIKCGHLRALTVVMYEGVVVALLKPMGSILHLRRPRLRPFWYFWRGFFSGLRHPVDCETMNYALPPTLIAALAKPR